MLVTIEDAKSFLRLDNNDENSLITSLILTSQEICLGVIRQEQSDLYECSETVKVAILYAVTYLYEHRENADHTELIKTLTSLLFKDREVQF